MTGDSISKYLRRWYILPLALIIAATLIVANEMGYQQSINTADEMTLATMKRRNLNVLLQQMLDAETGQRGYLLTGQAAYLEPYERASGAIGSTMPAPPNSIQLPFHWKSTSTLGSVNGKKEGRKRMSTSCPR